MKPPLNSYGFSWYNAFVNVKNEVFMANNVNLTPVHRTQSTREEQPGELTQAQRNMMYRILDGTHEEKLAQIEAIAQARLAQNPENE